MLTLRQSLYAKGSSGDPLPAVWKSLAQAGTQFLRGQLALICAGAGVGKSFFALSYAVKARVPTLYFSADSGQDIQVARSLAMLSGITFSEASKMYRDDTIPDDYDANLGTVPILWDYDPGPSLDRIEMALDSYEELYGDYPHLVVVDNITNVDNVDSDDPSGMEYLLEEFHKTARNKGCCFIGLHHVTRDYNDGDKPIPLSGVKGQIGRIPELILTLHRPNVQFGGGIINVSTVKNRSGVGDATGRSFVSLSFDGERMRIEDM